MKNYIERAMTFAEYIKLIDELLIEGKTTGKYQSAAMFDYAKLNRTRMTRLEKTVELEDSIKLAARSFDREIIWLIITEGWCGDAAQNIPVIEKIAAESDKIETKYILRDENPELMNQFLTDGARSIPKLIAMDKSTLEALGSWGSRPAPAQQLFLDMREKGVEKSIILEDLQRWYNSDNGRTLQQEFEVLLGEWASVNAQKAAA